MDSPRKCQGLAMIVFFALSPDLQFRKNEAQKLTNLLAGMCIIGATRIDVYMFLAPQSLDPEICTRQRL